MLEIDNRLRDAANRAASGVPATEVVRGLSLTEDAIRDWTRKYPADPWISKDVARIRRLYGMAGGVHAGVRPRASFASVQTRRRSTRSAR
ncbi:MAG TPA: hypothetical protein VIJ12_05875 [Candidatus Baltobacteraceae bacterium]